ncbi:hypothetical protein [Nocardia nova]|uniref:hypothetical protein n=1 Tax=Nocardia nova TaxID=37330 RepID=UPI0027395186|nr:hypothetical protein [Nocardia nova]
MAVESDDFQIEEERRFQEVLAEFAKVREKIDHISGSFDRIEHGLHGANSKAAEIDNALKEIHRRLNK